MQFDSTSIASTIPALLEAAQKSYQFDARPMLEDLGMDLSLLDVPGARLPDSVVDAAWEELRRQTGDDCFGLVVGRYVRPTTFHALGFAWLASSSLIDAFERLARYDRMVSTADRVDVISTDRHCGLRLEARHDDNPTPPYGVDAMFVAIMEMCTWISAADTAPLEVHLTHDGNDREGDYVGAFRAPVRFRAPDNRLLFDRALVEAPAPGANEQLAELSDRASDDYLASLDPVSVTREVRNLLMQLLPSGGASQERVAESLHRSCSSLQRDLRAEGTSFREVRDQTCKALATDYIRRRDVSLQEVAFLVGFSDQSNFSRAFRRWTGKSPKAWREASKT